MSLLISKAKFILTQDINRSIIQDGSIFVEEGRIVSVGKAEIIDPQHGQADRIIDASESIIAPGFVNCHTHTNSRLARGLADNLFVETWVNKRSRPFSAALKPEEAKLSALCLMAESLKSGTTFMAEYGGFHLDEIIKAVEESGIRAVVGKQAEGFWTDNQDVTGIEQFIKEKKESASGRISPWITIAPTAKKDFCRSVKEIADRNQVGIQAHIASTRSTSMLAREIIGQKGEFEHLEEVGILDSNFLGVHANWMNADELELIKKRNVKIAQCPTTNAFLGKGSLRSEKLPMMLKMGIPVALGTDGAACSNFFDLIRVAYMVMAHQDYQENATLITPQILLDMITVNGARALLSENDLGSIQIGKKADLVLVSTKGPEMIPLHNPISNLMLSASGANVDTVLVDGKIVVENGKLTTLDEVALYRQAEQVAKDVCERSGLQKQSMKFS
ncbi:MAG: amidohydrolase family protein [Thaumarchaeota archaeon]|nr:amidohydrolase family protein [Nitrososphaerota archaeon]